MHGFGCPAREGLYKKDCESFYFALFSLSLLAVVHLLCVSIMKILTCILTLAVVAKGAPTPEPHYIFPNIIGTAQWADVRQWTGYEGNRPAMDVTSTDIRCNKNGDKNFAKGSISIAAGSTTGFNSNQAIFHYGPALAYLAKVPEGKTAATWDGSGTAWFKIYEEHPTVANNQLNWPSYSLSPASPPFS
jgi:Auxiliary Activity family 9 (formerly GH61)